MLAGEKPSTDGTTVSNSQKDNGLGWIRTGDLRRVKAPSDASTRRRHNHLDHEPSARAKVSLGTLELSFDFEELRDYVEGRKCGLSEHSADWIDRASLDFWHITRGTISKERMEAFRPFVLTKYHSTWSHGKTLSFAKAFLSHLTKLHLDGRYKGFHLFLDGQKQ